MFRHVTWSVTTSSSTQSLTVCDTKPLPVSTRELHTSVMLGSVDWMGLTGCFEMSVKNYQSTQCNIPEG